MTVTSMGATAARATPPWSSESATGCCGPGCSTAPWPRPAGGIAPSASCTPTVRRTPRHPWYGDAGERAESYLSRTAPDVEVRRTCAAGDPASALAAACGASSLLVVGDRHRRLGSEAGRTTEELIAIAPCPVLVLGEDRAPSPVPVPPRAVVVVGLDEGAGAAAVLDHALRIAEMSASRSRWSTRSTRSPTSAGRIARRRDDDAGGEETDARARIEELVSARKDRFPDVPTSVVVAEDRPARLLLERALGADLVVVAHRCHDGRGPRRPRLDDPVAAPGRAVPGARPRSTGRRRGRRPPHPGGRRPMTDPLGAAARGDARPTPTGSPSACARPTRAVLWFLGDRVHKMKKPVDLGFCDFTTVELRREACWREIALNRRLSPEAYLGLETVLGPSGEAEEYLVAMRRMPADRSLASLVRAGEPVEDHLRAVARRLAGFHSARGAGTGGHARGLPRGGADPVGGGPRRPASSRGRAAAPGRRRPGRPRGDRRSSTDARTCSRRGGPRTASSTATGTCSPTTCSACPRPRPARLPRVRRPAALRRRARRRRVPRHGPRTSRRAGARGPVPGLYAEFAADPAPPP